MRHFLATRILVLCLLIATTTWAQEPTGEPSGKWSLETLAKKSTAELLELLETSQLWRYERREPHLEMLLKTLITRADKDSERSAIEQALRKRLRVRSEQRAAKSKQADALENARSKAKREEHNKLWNEAEELAHNLSLLTTLARIRKEADPLIIEVEGADKGLTGQSRRPPILKVALNNVSPDQSIWLQHGGDYRSGRQVRWRIHVWNDQGELLPTRGRLSPIGGGLSSTDYLPPGKRWDTELDLFQFVGLTEPGKYTLQVFYHNDLEIADFVETEMLDELILVKSKRIPLRLVKGPMLRVRDKASSRETAQQCIDAYDPNQKLRIAYDGYGKHQHEFIEPESSYGRLLQLKLDALPVLFGELEKPKLSFKKRAWILAVLFTITQERPLDPFQFPGVLPGHSYKTSYGWGSAGVLKQSYNETAQRELAARWLRFRDDYVIIEKSSNK